MWSIRSKFLRPVTRLAIAVAALLWVGQISGDTSRRPYSEIAEKAVIDGPVHNGVEIQVDLPTSQHVKNFGAPADGKGLCVFATMTMCARWHNIPELSDIIHKINEGGGWPEKVDKVFKQYAPNVKYAQYEDTPPAVLDRALSEGRPACVTYGFSERYKDQNGKILDFIYHMVLLVHLDDKQACILDNNFPGSDKLEWMSREEFFRRHRHPDGKGWAYVMLGPIPPPVPHN